MAASLIHLARGWRAVIACAGLIAGMGSPLGCTTTAVNFVVDDGGLQGEANPDGDGKAATDAPDLGTSPDLTTPVDSPDASPADLVADAPEGDLMGADGPPTDGNDLDIVEADLPVFIGASSADPSHYVQYKCCDAADTSCFVAIQGGDDVCRDTTTWTTYATTDCERQGLVVYGISLYVGC